MPEEIEKITLKDPLLEMKAILTAGWCQHKYARDASGAGVTLYDPKATCWCLEGAYFKTAYGSGLRLVIERNLPAAFRLLPVGMVKFNDDPGTTQEDVIALIDRCLADPKIA